MVCPNHRLPLRHEQVFVTVHDHSNMVLIFVTVNLEYVDFDHPTNHRNVVVVILDERSSISSAVYLLWPESEVFAFPANRMWWSLDRMEIHRMYHVLYRNHASYCTRSTPFMKRAEKVFCSVNLLTQNYCKVITNRGVPANFHPSNIR